MLTYTQHNVKRVRYTQEALEAKKQRDHAKLKEYLALTEDVLGRVCIDGSNEYMDR